MFNGVSLGLQMNDYDAFLRINSTLENQINPFWRYRFSYFSTE
jgi:hypothetical protein